MNGACKEVFFADEWAAVTGSYNFQITSLLHSSGRDVCVRGRGREIPLNIIGYK